MNEDQNKQIATRFIEEMWNQRKLQVADELFAVDCVTHQLRSGEDLAGVPRSAESVKREAVAWLTGFPDLEFVLEQMIAAGDRVVSHCTMRGTHSGAWMGIGATGREVSVPIITIHRIADGKIAEDWILVGSLMLFQQLGLVPQTQEIFGASRAGAKLKINLASNMELTGGCLCGETRYELKSAPFSLGDCHCIDCRRSAGAPVVTWGSVYRKDLRLTRGEPRKIRHAGRIRSFAACCGTHLFFEETNDSETIDITIASLDDPARFAPQKVIWLEDKLPWVELDESLPHFRKGSGN